MRSLIIAAVILSVIVFLTICNTIYVGNRVDEMLTLCEKLKRNSAPILVDELVNSWEHCRSIISLTTHHSEIDRAENAIDSLKHYIDSPADFGAQLETIINVLEYIGKGQRFSLEYIV